MVGKVILFSLSGAYTVEDLSEFHWSHIGTAFMLFYHFILLSPLSIVSGVKLKITLYIRFEQKCFTSMLKGRVYRKTPVNKF